jgi:maleylpyruvate isomerase
MSSSPDLGQVATQLDALHSSDQRLVRTVDALTDAQWRQASLLPGWSRAHVIAHLALNGEALARTLEALADGRVLPIYPSQERRDADIEKLAGDDISTLRERLFAATTLFREAAENVTESGHWEGTVHRLPDGPAWAAATLPETRRREVEIHHADLDAGYGHRDWPLDFAADLVAQVVTDHRAGDAEPFAIRVSDLGHLWSIGADGPIVEGTAADLGWWLTGRGGGIGLHVPGGVLPELGPWVRAPEPAES